VRLGSMVAHLLLLRWHPNEVGLNHPITLIPTMRRQLSRSVGPLPGFNADGTQGRTWRRYAAAACARVSA
jgi:hypothetical protein